MDASHSVDNDMQKTTRVSHWDDASAWIHSVGMPKHGQVVACNVQCAALGMVALYTGRVMLSLKEVL